MQFLKTKPLPWTGTMDGYREDGGGLIGIKNLIQLTQKIGQIPPTHTYFLLRFVVGPGSQACSYTGDFCSVLRCDSFIPRVTSNDQ